VSQGRYVSIIVPSANDTITVKNHLARIAALGAARIELILVDRSRSPDAKDALSKFGFHRTHAILGRDVSQADAINLGAEAATGAALTWLNVGDIATSDAIAKVLETLPDAPDARIVYGRARRHRLGGAADAYPVASKITPQTLYQACSISQPAAWITPIAWHQMRSLRPVFDCAFDYDFWIRAAQDGLPFDFIDDVLAEVDIVPDAKSFSQRAQVFRENCQLLMLHYGRCPPSAITALWAEALAPSEGFAAIAPNLLKEAAAALASIRRSAETVGDIQTLERLRTDARLHFLSRGLAVEMRRDSYLGQTGRIRIRSDLLPITLLFRFDTLPTLDQMSLLFQPDARPAQCTTFPSIGCIAARIDSDGRSNEDGCTSLDFLTTSDFGARLIDVWQAPTFPGYRGIVSPQPTQRNR
jgi:hypothetical protein